MCTWIFDFEQEGVLIVWLAVDDLLVTLRPHLPNCLIHFSQIIRQLSKYVKKDGVTLATNFGVSGCARSVEGDTC